MSQFIKGAIFTLSVFLMGPTLHAQIIRDVFNTVKDKTNPGKTNSNNLNNLSNTEIVGGLREALEVGTKNASARLSKENGFYGNSLVKVLMPEEAKRVESTMRQMGMGDLVDKTILSMNRAAEDAASSAVPIFVNAITSMSIQDGISIVRGGNGAATNYLKSKTTRDLTEAFRPVIQSSLDKFNVGTYWSQLFNAYNRIPTTVNKVNPDLPGYVTERALAGLFLSISEEENKIRTNPAARVTDLLSKVFGAK
jgi:hypothetical protein